MSQSKYTPNMPQIKQIHQQHSNKISALIFNQNKNQIISASYDSTIKIWDINSSKCLHTLLGHSDEVNSIDISPNGETLVSGSFDKSVRLWNLCKLEKYLTYLAHRGGINSVTFSPDGKRVASGSNDKTIKVWNTSQFQCIGTLTGHTDIVTVVRFSYYGAKLISGCKDGSIGVWFSHNQKLMHVLKGAHYGSITTLTLNPKIKRGFISGGNDGIIKFWTTNELEYINSFEAHSQKVVSIIAKDDKIITLCSDNVLKFWDYSSLNTLKSSNIFSQSTISTLCLTNFQSEESVIFGCQEGQIAIKNIQNDNIYTISSGQDDNITSVCIHPENYMIAIGCENGSIHIYCIKEQNQKYLIISQKTKIQCLDFDVQNDLIVCSLEGVGIQVWNYKESILVTTLVTLCVNQFFVLRDTFSNLLLATDNKNGAQVWDFANKNLVIEKEGSFHNIVYSVEAKIIGVQNKHNIEIWDHKIETKKAILRQPFKENDEITSLHFICKGQGLVIFSGNKIIRTWMIQKRRCIDSIQFQNQISNIVLINKFDFLCFNQSSLDGLLNIPSSKILIQEGKKQKIQEKLEYFKSSNNGLISVICSKNEILLLQK